MNRKHVEFALCVRNEGYDDLEVWKLYQVVSDPKAGGLGCIWVIDESGEDYLYPADGFVAIDIPVPIRSRLPEWRPGNRRLSA